MSEKSRDKSDIRKVFYVVYITIGHMCAVYDNSDIRYKMRIVHLNKILNFCRI